MKYKITVLSKSSMSKSKLTEAMGVLKAVGESFKCEFEVIYRHLKKKEDLTTAELELCKNSDAVLLETEAQELNTSSADEIKAALHGASKTYTQTEYGAIFETASEEEDDEKSILDLANVLDYLKLNDAARLVRQGVEHAKSRGTKISDSNKKIAEAVGNYIKTKLSAASPKKLQEAYDQMLFSFGGVVDL